MLHPQTPEEANFNVSRFREEKRRRDAIKLRGSLSAFVKAAWNVIEPTTTLVWNWHLDVVCDHLQALLEHRLPKQNLIINVPPGSMKSTIVSVCAPAWAWIQGDGALGDLGPSWRGLFAAGSDGLAMRDAMKARDILDSDWYQGTFLPDWSFSKDQNAKGFYKNSVTGFRKSLSANATVTGDRGNCIFVDDPLDAKKAFSKPARDEIKLWWDNAYANRLNDLKTGTRCVIMQRLHEEDLVGHILSKEKEAWEVLKIRQGYEADSNDPVAPTGLTLEMIHARKCPLNPRPGQSEAIMAELVAQGYTADGWIDPRRDPEALMFPERFPQSVLDSEFRRLGSTGYAGQHQQRPAPLAGNLFHREWFSNTYPLEPMAQRGQCQRIVQSWDTAAKRGQENDYSVCTTWGIGRGSYSLLEVWKEKVEFPDLKAQVKALAAKWKPAVILMEDTSAGVGILQELKRDTRLPLIPISVPDDKVARANQASPTFEAGNVLMPADPPAWVADYVDSLCLFPAAKNDDEVDSTTQFINWANSQGDRGPLILGGSRRISDSLPR